MTKLVDIVVHRHMIFLGKRYRQFYCLEKIVTIHELFGLLFVCLIFLLLSVIIFYLLESLLISLGTTAVIAIVTSKLLT